MEFHELNNYTICYRPQTFGGGGGGGGEGGLLKHC